MLSKARKDGKRKATFEKEIIFDTIVGRFWFFLY